MIRCSMRLRRRIYPRLCARVSGLDHAIWPGGFARRQSRKMFLQEKRDAVIERALAPVVQ